MMSLPQTPASRDNNTSGYAQSQKSALVARHCSGSRRARAGWWVPARRGDQGGKPPARLCSQRTPATERRFASASLGWTSSVCAHPASMDRELTWMFMSMPVGRSTPPALAGLRADRSRRRLRPVALWRWAAVVAVADPGFGRVATNGSVALPPRRRGNRVMRDTLLMRSLLVLGLVGGLGKPAGSPGRHTHGGKMS